MRGQIQPTRPARADDTKAAPNPDQPVQADRRARLDTDPSSPLGVAPARKQTRADSSVSEASLLSWDLSISESLSDLDVGALKRELRGHHVASPASPEGLVIGAADAARAPKPQTQQALADPVFGDALLQPMHAYLARAFAVLNASPPDAAPDSKVRAIEEANTPPPPLNQRPKRRSQKSPEPGSATATGVTQRARDAAASVMASPNAAARAPHVPSIALSPSRDALQVAEKLLPTLLAQGLSTEDVWAIARKHGGGQALHAVSHALTHSDLTVDEAVSIACHHGSQRALHTVQVLMKPFIAMGVPREDVVAVASHDGGSQALQSLWEQMAALQVGGLNTDQMVRIARAEGGSQALQTVASKLGSLQTAGLSTQQIVDIASKSGGSSTLRTVESLLPALRDLGLSVGEIADVASRNAGGRALRAVKELGPSLCDPSSLGMSIQQVARVAARPSGPRALRAVSDRLREIRQIGMTSDEVFALAMQKDAGQALDAALRKKYRP